MAYKQNNPLSRRSSSPLFRKQGVSPLNNRRLDPELDPRKNPISRKSSSPLHKWPTPGSKAGSIEEAYELAPLKPGQKYVDLNPDAAPGEVRFDAVQELDEAFGGLDVDEDTSKLLKHNYIKPMPAAGHLVNRGGYGLRNRYSPNYGDYINHPFGWMNTGYGTADDGSFRFSETGSQVFGPNKGIKASRAFPVSGTGYTTEADLTADFDENMMYTGTPNFNPYTQKQDTQLNTRNFMKDSSARGGKGQLMNWNSPTGFSIEGIRTPYHFKKGPREIYENVLNEEFNQRETPMISLGDFRNQYHDLEGGGRGEFGRRSDNAAINKIEIPNALSLYSNIDPNSMFTSSGSGDRVEYSDQFKQDYPSWLAGGLQLDQGPTWSPGGSQPDLYDPSTNLFGEGTYTSSRFAPRKVRGKKTGEIAVDGPMTVAGEMVRSGDWTMDDYKNYLDLVKSNYGRGNVAGQNAPQR